MEYDLETMQALLEVLMRTNQLLAAAREALGNPKEFNAARRHQLDVLLNAQIRKMALAIAAVSVPWVLERKEKQLPILVPCSGYAAMEGKCALVTTDEKLGLCPACAQRELERMMSVKGDV